MAKHSTTVGIDVSQDALDIWVHPVGESWRIDYRTEHLRELVGLDSVPQHAVQTFPSVPPFHAVQPGRG